MNYKKESAPIKVHVQAVNAIVNHDMQQQIHSMIGRLQRHISAINWIDIYFKKERKHCVDKRTVGVRLGIPGNDVFACTSGIHWISLLRAVEEKLERQLKRRKVAEGLL